MNAKIYAVIAIISGNILNCPYAFADNTELFANQQTTTKGTPPKKVRKKTENKITSRKTNSNPRFQKKSPQRLAKTNHLPKTENKVTLRKTNSNLRFQKKSPQRLAKTNHLPKTENKVTLRKTNSNPRFQKKNQPRLAETNHFPKTENKVTLRKTNSNLHLKNSPKASGIAIKISQKRQQTNINPSDYFDINTFRAHRPFEEQCPLIILAGAPNPIYRYYDPSTGTLNFSQDNKNYFEIMLNLEHDLSVAENQCDWNAKEIIAKALLNIIEEYGTFPQDDNPETQTMVDAQNMAALHAAIALKQVLAQRKTTVICKNNSNLSQNDIYKTYIQTSMEEDLALDHPLEQHLKTANSGEFLMGSSIFPIGSKGQFNDVMELAKIIDNPGFLDMLFSSFDYLQTLERTTQQNRDLYRNAVVNFVDQNFNFTGKEFLRKITMDYFMKIYDKTEHSINKIKSFSRFKLRDCNGRDIYGNVDICTYCATFELIRRNPENKDFITFGGMFDLPTINKIINEVPAKDGYQLSLSVPYRRFNRDGQKVYDVEEEREKLNKKIDDFIEKHSQPPTAASYYKCQRNGKFFYMTDKENDEFKKMVLPPSPLDLFRTNDLSSRTRVQASYLVLVNSMNDWGQRSPFLQPNAKKKFLIPVDKNVSPMLNHWTVKGIKIPVQDLTLPTLMSGYIICKDKNQSNSEPNNNKLNFMFGASGISIVYFSSESQQLKKRFLNETTTQPSESAWVDLGLGCTHIINPFSPIVGMAGFNGHARLILQD